jgi:iron complex transport system substrate-binding protein
MQRVTKALGVLVLAGAVAAACGGSGNSNKTSTVTAGATKPAASPPALATPGTAVTSAATTVTAAATIYPLTTTDMLGRKVTIARKPVAVAAISPATVEYVFAVGAATRTRSTSVTFPSQAAGTVSVGPAENPNLQLLAAQKPDLIVADSVSQPQLQQSLEGLGVPVVFVGAKVFSDAPKGLRLMGQVLDHQQAGEEAAQKLEKTLSDLQAKLPAQRPRVLVLTGTPGDYSAAKPESYVGDLVRLLGGDNVAKGQPDVGPLPGFTKLSLEAILAAQPDVVLAIAAWPPVEHTLADALLADPAWANVPAVKNKRVAEINTDIFLLAPGPRAIDALAVLTKLLYPGGLNP